MATKLLLLAIFLSVYVSVAVGQGSQSQSQTQLSGAQQCRLQGLAATQPSQRIESEGGITEMWDENQDQFQCAGVAPFRNTLRPNGLSLPNFHPSPRLVYIERGQGLLSISYPGCAETFHSDQSSGGQQGRSEEEEERGGRRRRDQHQKVHRIRQGDIIALPAGAAHWCFNDGNEDLVAVSITDLNHQANQLDQKFRAFYLAGGSPRRGQQSQQAQQSFQNIFRAFDEELMAEAFNVPVELMRRMQKEDNRGLIVNAREMRSLIRPDENGENEEEEEEKLGTSSNGLEETLCTMRIRQSIDNRRQADIYSRQAGSLNIVNQHKLPILRYMDLSAEKGNLFPNAMYTPHWSMKSHCIVYVISGDAQVQVVDSNGQTVMNDKANQGQMFVVPQFFAATLRAGNNGFEYVSVKTSGSPMKNPLAGYTSVFRAMPLEVLTNSYQISPKEAQDLKLNRGGESFLLSPRRSS